MKQMKAKASFRLKTEA